MAGDRWIFSKEQLADTPSRKAGINGDTELSYRQQAANFIQDMGQRLQVTQLCINTAIVYMHRFYMFHSFKRFHRNQIAAACLFLAAKVEEQPRKLEHVIKFAHLCLHRDAPPLDTKSEGYLEQAQELVCNENILLQSLGFDITVDHPHTHVVKTCQLVRASKDLAQTSYFLATNSLHLTHMCLQYRPTIVACVCIYLGCKWSSWEFPKSNEGKDWWVYVDKQATLSLLEELTQDFLTTLDRCPSKLKRKILTWKSGARDGTLIKEEKKEEKSSESSVKKERLSTTSTTSNTSRHAAPSSSQPMPTNHDRDRKPDGRNKLPHSLGGSHRMPKNSALLKDQQHGNSSGVAASSVIDLPGSRSSTPNQNAAQSKEAASTDTATPQMKRVKSESTLTPREYLQRKERERQAAGQSANVTHRYDAHNIGGSGIKLHSSHKLDRHHMDILALAEDLKHPQEQAIENPVEQAHRDKNAGHVKQQKMKQEKSDFELRIKQENLDHELKCRSLEVNQQESRHDQSINLEQIKSEHSIFKEKPPESPQKKHSLKIKIPKDKVKSEPSLKLKIPTEHLKGEHHKHKDKHKHRSDHHKTPPGRKSHSHDEKVGTIESPQQPIKLNLGSMLKAKAEMSKSSHKMGDQSGRHKEKELKSPPKVPTIKIKDLVSPPAERQKSSHKSGSGHSSSKSRRNTPDHSQRKRPYSPGSLHQPTSHTVSPQPPTSKMARNDSFSSLASVDNLMNMPLPQHDPFMQTLPDNMFDNDTMLTQEANGSGMNSHRGAPVLNIREAQQKIQHLINVQKAQLANMNPQFSGVMNPQQQSQIQHTTMLPGYVPPPPPPPPLISEGRSAPPYHLLPPPPPPENL